MSEEIQTQILKILELSTKQQVQTRELIEDIKALCSIQYILLSALCRYDPKLQEHFCKVLGKMVNRPQKTDNRFFEETLQNMLLFAESPDEDTVEYLRH